MTTRIYLKGGDCYLSESTIEELEAHLTVGEPINVRWGEVGGQQYHARLKIINIEDIFLLREDFDENTEGLT